VWIVLTDDGDPCGPWLTRGLQRVMGAGAGRDPAWVRASMLGSGADWSHRVGSGGGASFRVRLADGMVLDSERITGVVNRARFVPQADLETMRGDGPSGLTTDGEYMAQERAALHMSALWSLADRCVNVPQPHSLCGGGPYPVSIAQAAARAGFGFRPVRLGEQFGPSDVYPWVAESDIAGTRGGGRAWGATHEGAGPREGPRVHVIGDRVWDVDGMLGENLAEAGLARVAHACGLRMAELRFEVSSSGFAVLSSISPTPDLRLLGDQGPHAVAELLASLEGTSVPGGTGASSGTGFQPVSERETRGHPIGGTHPIEGAHRTGGPHFTGGTGFQPMPSGLDKGPHP